MSRRYLIFGGGILALLILAALLALTGRSDDVIVQRRPLSEWVFTFDIWHWPGTAPAAMVLAEHGPQAEPVLRGMLQSRESGLAVAVRRWLARQGIVKFRFRPARDYQNCALGACNLLGSQARGTVSAIAQLVNDYPSRMGDKAVAGYALHTLGTFGTNGVAVLVGVLAHPDSWVRVEAARLLGTAPDSCTERVVTALRSCLGRNDATLAQTAELSLELIQERQAQQLSPVTGEPSAEPAKPAIEVWSVKRGARVTASSGLVPGFKGDDLFGDNSSSVEPGAVIFKEFQPDGFAHFIEWQTPAPVKVLSFGLLAAHDGAHVSFQRAFREFRLYAYDEAAGEFRRFYAEHVSVPYGQGFFSGELCLFRNLAAPTVARRFRVESVQNGAGPWQSPRLIELYGFDRPVTPQDARKTITSQEPLFLQGLDPKVANAASG